VFKKRKLINQHSVLAKHSAIEVKRVQKEKADTPTLSSGNTGFCNT